MIRIHRHVGGFMASKKRRKGRKKRRRSRGAPQWLFPVAITSIFLLILGYFIITTVTAPGGKSEAFCTVVIDRTNSVQTPETTKLYARLANSAVDECAQQNGTLDLWAIDQAGPQAVLLGNYQLFGGNKHSSVLRNRARAGSIADAKSKISNVLSQASTGGIGGSNIVSTMSEAASTMQEEASKAGGGTMYMVVLSDGLQLEGGVSVKNLASLTSNPQMLVATANNLVKTNLKGINTSFYGVSSGQSTAKGQQLPLWFESKISIFWHDFVSSNGGNLCMYQGDQSDGNVLNHCGAN